MDDINQFKKITCTSIKFKDSVTEDEKDRYYDGRCTFTFSGPGKAIMKMQSEIYDACTCTINVEGEHTPETLKNDIVVEMHTQREEEEVLRRHLQHYGVKIL